MLSSYISGQNQFLAWRHDKLLGVLNGVEYIPFRHVWETDWADKTWTAEIDMWIDKIFCLSERNAHPDEIRIYHGDRIIDMIISADMEATLNGELWISEKVKGYILPKGETLRVQVTGGPNFTRVYWMPCVIIR